MRSPLIKMISADEFRLERANATVTLDGASGTVFLSCDLGDETACFSLDEEDVRDLYDWLGKIAK